MHVFVVNIIGVIALITSFLLFKKASGSMSLTKLNMISIIFYLDILLFSFIGSMLVVNNIDKHYLISELRNNDIRLYASISIWYTMICLPIGMLIAKKFLQLNSIKSIYNYYLDSKIYGLLSSKDISTKIVLYVLSFLSIVSILYVIINTNHIPIFELLKGSSYSELLKDRQLSSSAFAGNQYVKNILALLLTQLLCFVAYGYMRQRKSLVNTLWFAIMLAFTCFILLYDLQKAPIFMFAIGFIIFEILIRGKIKLKYFIFASAAIVIGIIAFYVLLPNNFDSKQLLSYNSGPAGRVFLTQISGTYLSFDAFPAVEDHIGFSSLSNFISDIFNMDYHERSARTLMEIYRPENVNNGTAGVMNSLFIGEAWANFGFIGVMISPFYVGFLIGLLYYILIKLDKTPIFMAILGYFTIKRNINGGFNDYLYNFSYILILFCFIVLVLLQKKLKKKAA